MLVFLCLKVKFQIQPIIFNRMSIPIMRVPRISILKSPIRRPTWKLRKNSLLFSWGKRHVCVWIEAVNYSESEDKLIVPTKLEIACTGPGAGVGPGGRHGAALGAKPGRACAQLLAGAPLPCFRP